MYHRIGETKIDKIRPILQDPQFAGLSPEHTSTEEVYIRGVLPNEQARQVLEEKLRPIFGDEEARSITCCIDIAEP